MANKKEKKERKPLSKKALNEVVVKGALMTSKKYVVHVDKGNDKELHMSYFASFLQKVLPKNMTFSVAENTTGKGQTFRVRNAFGDETERFFLPSHKVKYTGWGFGAPQLKKLIEGGLPEAQVCQVQQGSKKYWYCDDYNLLAAYLMDKYHQ